MQTENEGKSVQGETYWNWQEMQRTLLSVVLCMKKTERRNKNRNTCQQSTER